MCVSEFCDDVYGPLGGGEVEHVGSFLKIFLEWSCCGPKRDVRGMTGPPFGVMTGMHDVGVDVAINHKSSLKYCIQTRENLGSFGYVLESIQPHGEGGVSDFYYGFRHIIIVGYG